MKTKIIILLVLVTLTQTVDAQFSGALKKLKDKVKSELLNDGSGSGGQNAQVTNCACKDAITVFQFGGNLQINYKEIEVCVTDDGKVLLQNRMGNPSPNYYISDKGVISGPYDEDSFEVKQFSCFGTGSIESNSEYISKVDGKYIITFGGKKYGPFAEVQNFCITPSKNKFAAFTIKDKPYDNIVTEEEAKKMENMPESEKMAYSMQLATKMQQRMQEQMKNGYEPDMTMRLTTNISGVNWNQMLGAQFDSKIKFDDICMLAGDKITDLNGNVLLKLSDIPGNKDKLWISQDNSKCAWYDNGSITFNDGKECRQVFSPFITKDGNTEYLNYMYYLPSEDAIKMCKIEF